MVRQLQSTVRLFIASLLAVLATCCSPVANADTDYRIGLARTVITPTEPIWMAGYASRDKPSQGTLADLHAKAMAIEDSEDNRALLLTVDVIGFSDKVANHICGEVMKKVPLKRRQILLAPSHTHTGPVIGLRGSIGYDLKGENAEVVHRYCEQLAQHLATIAAEAFENLQPSNLSWGVGVTNFVMNRREFTGRGVRLGFNPSGYVDRSVPVLRIDSPSGDLRALVFGCACHNTTLTGKHFELSGDYAGFAQEYIEHNHSGVQAMFMIGCAGSANPHPRGTVDDARTHGEILGEEVCRVIANDMTPVGGPLTATYELAELPLAPIPPRDKLEEMASGPSYVAYNAKRMIKSLDEGESIPNTYNAPFAVWQFGDDLTLVALSGEVVNGYVPLLRAALGQRKLWISAYANDCYGYLPTAKVLAEGGYETRCLYTATGFFPPEVEDFVVNKVVELAKKAGRDVTK